MYICIYVYMYICIYIYIYEVRNMYGCFPQNITDILEIIEVLLVNLEMLGPDPNPDYLIPGGRYGEINIIFG